MNENVLINTLKIISQVLNNIKYECCSYVYTSADNQVSSIILFYTLADDQMSSVFSCRGLADEAIKNYKTESIIENDND